MKRAFDLVVSIAALLLLSPLLAVLVVLLAVTGEHNIFYRQRRVGYRGRHFRIWKFATMLKDSPRLSGGLVTVRNDKRVLPVGRFLRSTKLNELPQLLNVIAGEMSLVGPRPVVPESFAAYRSATRDAIADMKPGLTGIGSIVFRDEEAIISTAKQAGNDPWHYYTTVIFPYKGALEVWYRSHRSFCVDVAILLLTAHVVLFPDSRLLFRVFKDLPTRPF